MVEGGKVLMQKALTDCFWALPGGRCELLECTKDTIVREMKEELGEDVTVNRLLFVVENFYEYKSKKYHKIGFYYLVNLPQNSRLLKSGEIFHSIDCPENPVELEFRWFEIATLEDEEVYPTFLRTALKGFPKEIAHVVHHD